jgi:chorismate mutase
MAAWIPGGDSAMSKSNNIIILPELEELKAEVERLRTELSVLMQERDELMKKVV